MMTSATHSPAGITAHHAPEEIAVRRNANSMMVPHVIAVGSPEPEERERRLVEDRHRDRQDDVGDQQRPDLREHVPEDDPGVARPSDRALAHVDPLAHALHLRSDDPRRGRPQQQRDHEDQVGEARAPDGRDDDREGQVGDHQEVVGDAHQDGIGGRRVAGECPIPPPMKEQTKPWVRRTLLAAWVVALG